MYKFLRSLFLLLIVSAPLKAQTLPKEGSVLNYRIVGFLFPATKAPAKEKKYKIEIATGNYNNVDSFCRHIIVSANSKSNRIIIELPSFGTQYTWRIVYDYNNKAGNELHHFCTGTPTNIDTVTTRLRVQVPAAKYKDAFVFLDENRALYNMEGHLVWFLPKIDSPDTKTVSMRDIKLSPQGTITCMTIANNIYEVNYNGAILWAGPDNTSDHTIQASYHHEFTKLGNGHYMVLGSEFLPWKTNTTGDIIVAGYDKRERYNSNHHRMALTTVMEYDKKGKVVWCWSSYKYYRELAALKKSTAFKVKNPQDPLHANAFFFDEKKKELYISFRNTSQIIKVAYPSGKIKSIYSGESTGDTADKSIPFFCMQHACKISKQGYLYFFNNNNNFRGNGCPTIVMMQQPHSKKNKLEKVWEYDCPSNSLKEEEEIGKNQRASRSGGNVMELPDQSLFVSSCTPYGDVFIVNKEKKILWSAVAEQIDTVSKGWVPYKQYRASLIPDHKALEQLIWNSETPVQSFLKGR